MKFTCNSTDLLKSIHIVEKAISSRSSLPVLENIYFELSNDRLKLRGNDLEIGIENSLPVNDPMEGSILVKAKTISSIVSKLNNQPLNFKVDDGKVNIFSEDRVGFDILATSSDDYPVFPAVESGVKLSFKAEELKDLIRHTLFAVSFDETKQFLNGILIKSEGNLLRFVSTDGYRLSIKTHTLSEAISDFSVIVPFKAMNEINKILQQTDNNVVVELNISQNQVAFKLPDVLLVSRVIVGQFPDYKQVLPKENEHSFSVSRRGFLEACERASIIALASNNVVRLNFDGEKLNIKSVASGMGEFQEALPIKLIKGNGQAKIAFNVRLILDSIKNLTMDDLTISFNNELSPCVIQPVKNNDYTYIIMPIRTSDYQGENS